MKTDDDTIILDRSRNSRAFEDPESLWARELSRIMDRLWDHTESLDVVGPRATDEWQRQSGEHRPYLSIAIFGPSGSGKSSLLRTLVRVVNGGEAETVEVLLRDRGAEQGKDKDLHRLRGLLYALPVMQPDRFAEHDHFLYAFLATALKEEKEQREKRERGRDERRRDEDRRYEPDALSPVQQRFQELSDFLRVIDEPEKSRDYDPLGLSLERLERHTSALLLREKIGRFIDSLADELAGKPPRGKENSVVLLTVDDVDMSPEHLVTALKVYQTYLLHPRLVPVFTFTDRTAEEILRGYFHRHLSTFSLSDRKGGARQPMTFATAGEGSQRLTVGDQLALQYLARCFPVRNRIRLGPAPARFRDMQYMVSGGGRGEGERCEKRPVATLLLAASQLLFGTADRDAKNRIRAALRPSTLRRQFHVVDEMTAVGVEDYLVQDEGAPGGWRLGFSRRFPEKISTGERHPGLTPKWFEIFDRAAWALMNVHRDVLREYDLYLEDLYSWTPQGLRRLLLDTLLAQPIEARRALIRRWRFRLSSRRGETISLLAANVFRPWIPGEEPTGDAAVMKFLEEAELKGVTEGRNHLSAPTALIWFLDLAIGFYQPQILAWNRPNDVAVSNPQKGRVVGVGWNLETGPVNAIRAAEENDSLAAAGMLFLDPRAFADSLRWPCQQDPKPDTSDHNVVLLLRCWTYYGYSRGRYWAAISFWRGLGLIGQLLRAYREMELEKLAERRGHQADKDQNDNRTATTDPPREEKPKESKEKQKKEERKLLVKKVSGILRNHLIRGLVPGQLVGEGETGSRLDLAFKRWDLTPVGRADDRLPLENAIVDWLTMLGKLVEGDVDKLIKLMPETRGDLRDDLEKRWERHWKRSLIRRFHGDDIVGSLLTRLNATYIDDQEKDDLFKVEIGFREQSPDTHTSVGAAAKESDAQSEGSSGDGANYRWNAGIAMTNWTRVFLDYWRGLKPMQELLRKCPLLAPFTEGPLTDLIREETVRMTLMSAGWSPKPRERKPAKPEALQKKARELREKWEKTEGKLSSRWEKSMSEFGVGKESKELKRIQTKETTETKTKTRDPWFGRRLDAEPSEFEGEQIDSVMNQIEAVCLFYGLPRVRPEDFRPAVPFGSATPPVVIHCEKADVATTEENNGSKGRQRKGKMARKGKGRSGTADKKPAPGGKEPKPEP